MEIREEQRYITSDDKEHKSHAAAETHQKGLDAMEEVSGWLDELTDQYRIPARTLKLCRRFVDSYAFYSATGKLVFDDKKVPGTAAGANGE